MKRILVAVLGVLASALVGLSIVAARFESKVAPKTFVGPVEVGGLAPVEARKKLRVWWESQKQSPIRLTSGQLTGSLPEMAPDQLGISVDDEATIAPLPMQEFKDAAAEALGQKPEEPKRFPIVFRSSGSKLDALTKAIREAQPEPRPAAFRFENGVVETTPEATTLRLKEEGFQSLVEQAVLGDRTIDLPLEEAPKKIPDDQLASLSEVMYSFTTHFPVKMATRNNNIRVASSKLNNIILAPGERLSFNDRVGRRTIEAGFEEAGVYKNGKHDKGIGGGICQVSTTLYNASLYSNLKIVSRHNHSMPVAYVPVGRDATVDYGSIDLVIENNYPTPIAISSEYRTGSLTFRIFGKKDPSLRVVVTADKHKSWDRGIKVTQDPSLPKGKSVVVDKGSMGHSIYTYRLVYHDGKLVEKQPLGRSYYAGAPKLISSNGPYTPVAKVKKTASIPPRLPSATPVSATRP